LAAQTKKLTSPEKRYMSEIALNKEMNIEVKLRLIGKGDDEPLNGDGFSVRL
jgi:hypothetical protein